MPAIITKSYENQENNIAIVVFNGQTFIEKTVVHPKGDFIRTYLNGCIYGDEASIVFDKAEATYINNEGFLAEGPVLCHDQFFATEGIDRWGIYFMIVKHTSSRYN
jgi:hypothetical protein